MKIMEYYAPVIFSHNASADKTAKKIRSFQDAHVGWCFGKGVPATNEATHRALNVLNDLISLGFTVTDAFPGIEGEIAVVAYAREHTIEVIVEVDGSYTFTRDKGEQEFTRQERVKLPMLKGYLAGASRDIWNSSAYYTRSTSTETRGASKALHSETLLKAGSHSSQWRVSKIPELNSATIAKNIIAA